MKCAVPQTASIHVMRSIYTVSSLSGISPIVVKSNNKWVRSGKVIEKIQTEVFLKIVAQNLNLCNY